MDLAILDALDALKQRAKDRRREELPKRLASSHFNWWRRVLHLATFFGRDYIDCRMPLWIRLILRTEDAFQAYIEELQERFGSDFQVYLGRPIGYPEAPYDRIYIEYKATAA